MSQKLFKNKLPQPLCSSSARICSFAHDFVGGNRGVGSGSGGRCDTSISWKVCPNSSL